MRISRTVGLLGVAATLALAGLLRVQTAAADTVDPFSLTTTDDGTTDSSILPGLITVSSVEPASSPVASPASTVTRPGRSP